MDMTESRPAPADRWEDRIPDRRTFTVLLVIVLVLFQLCIVSAISPAISSSVFADVMREAGMHPETVDRHVDAQGGRASSMSRASSGDVNYVLYTAESRKDAEGIVSTLDDRLVSLGANKIVLPAIEGRHIRYTLPDDSSYSVTVGSSDGVHTVLIGHGVYEKDRKTMSTIESDIKEASLNEH